MVRRRRIEAVPGVAVGAQKGDIQMFSLDGGRRRSPRSTEGTTGSTSIKRSPKDSLSTGRRRGPTTPLCNADGVGYNFKELCIFVCVKCGRFKV